MYNSKTWREIQLLVETIQTWFLQGLPLSLTILVVVQAVLAYKLPHLVTFQMCNSAKNNFMTNTHIYDLHSIRYMITITFMVHYN